MSILAMTWMATAGGVPSTELRNVLWFIVAVIVGLALANWLRGDDRDLDT